MIVAAVACGEDETGTPEASGANETPAATSPAAASGCTEANATDLTADDPYTVTVRNLQFKPDCFIADSTAALAIENKDDVDHTFSIDGTLVDAPLRSGHTYRHEAAPDILGPGTYAFHCQIHPEMTGTMIVV